MLNKILAIYCTQIIAIMFLLFFNNENTGICFLSLLIETFLLVGFFNYQYNKYKRQNGII